MLLDVNTVHWSYQHGKYVHWTFIQQYIAYICMHHWAISSRILLRNRLSVSDLLQGANSKEPTFHADKRIQLCHRCAGIGFRVHQSWRWICNPTRCWLLSPSPCIQWHGVWRRVQTQAISEHFLWQNVQMFWLGFFANTSCGPFLRDGVRATSPAMTPPTPPTPPPPPPPRRRARVVLRRNDPCRALGPPPACPWSAAPLGV